MTLLEAEDIIYTEYQCILRAVLGCDKCCENCNLVREPEEILAAYKLMLAAAEKVRKEC